MRAGNEHRSRCPGTHNEIKRRALDHADGGGDVGLAQDVSREEQDARGPAFNDKYMKKEQTHSQGAPEETERGRRAATCRITMEPTLCGGRGSCRGPSLLDTKSPSAVMLPSAGSSSSMRDSSLTSSNQRVLQRV